MKKGIFLIVFLLATISISSAQYFAGGSFSFSSNGGSNDDGTTSTEKASYTNYNLYPKAGYIMSDKIWVGVQLGFGANKNTNPGTPDLINKTTQLGLTPFARYYALRNNKLGLFAEGQVGLNLSSSKSELGSTTTDGPKTTTMSFSVFPGLSYDVSDKVTLEARINGFNLGYSYSVSKFDVAGTEVKNKSTSLGFGGNLNNILTSGSVSIGAIIKL